MFPKRMESAASTAKSGLHGSGSPAGGQKIIHDDDTLAFLNRVLVDFEGIGPVLEGIVVLYRRRWQFPRFADGNETGVEAVGERRPKDKAARFHAQNQVNFFADVVHRECIDQTCEAEFVFQQRSDVVKKYSLLWKVWHLTNQLLQLIAIYRFGRCNGWHLEN